MNSVHTNNFTINREAILNVADQIKRIYKPEKIYLFGSYAYGTPGQGSDVDLLVVMPFQKKASQQAIEILKNISYNFGLDLIVKTPEDLKERIKSGDFFLQEAVEQGILLYESDS